MPGSQASSTLCDGPTPPLLSGVGRPRAMPVVLGKPEASEPACHGVRHGPGTREELPPSVRQAERIWL